MISGLWGKKIGMTQVFSDDQKVIPVTAISLGTWYVTQVKTRAKEGYSAVQVGCVKQRFADREFSRDWLSAPRVYFSTLREIPLHDEEAAPAVGQRMAGSDVLAEGECVDVFGRTSGKGFQGVVKRHDYSGGQRSHGDRLGRNPGSLFGCTSCGHVPKGKAMPGRMGFRKQVMRNLHVVRVEPEANVILVKGSVPGKSGSLLFMRRCS